jgi:hypothetical protein
METLGTILAAVGGIISFVCYILVLVKMFQNGKTGLAIVCIVLFCVCGLGVLIAFIYGWVKSGEWNIRNIMLAWTVGIVLDIAGSALNPTQFTKIQTQIQQQQP